ncbi:glycosyltransferase family 2 protein [Ottowia thiooxydans]|uniref:glycosyltransferase family 2 protein n=1 Tax=Ottowia thiooxydans TaxID=219182 RepID=UPI000686C420|nr:glycosyltransferase family 2 protein [Ottowia thiooxydans]
MLNNNLKLSIVVPVYRSEKILHLLAERIDSVFGGSNPQMELILVDDRSPDDSWRVIEELSRTYGFVRGVQLSRNAGQHNAIMAGLSVSVGEIVVLMDDDLQHPPEDIPRLVAEIEKGNDVCYTHYRNRKHEAWKKWGSRFNDKVANLLLNKPDWLYLSSFKALHRRVVDEVKKYSGPYAYVDGLILGVTDRIASIDIDHGNRHSGAGNYNLKTSISLWLKMATSFSVFPLRLATFVGLILAAISALIAIFIILRKIFHPDVPAGWSSLIVVTLFMGGIQMAFLGLLGEYLGRAYLNLNKKPQFVIRQITK